MNNVNIMKGLLRSFATICFFTMGSRITGFFRTMLMANYLGAGAMMDALVLAIKIPGMLRRIFAEGAFNAAFVPMFAGMIAKGDIKKAKTYAENVLSILVIILSIITIFAEIFMPNFLSTLAPGFSSTPTRMQYAIEFTRITFPFIILISVCALFSGILNSMERFAFAASSPMIGNTAIIITFFLIKSYTSSHGQAFAIGVAMCGIAQAIWVLLPSFYSGMRLKPVKPIFNKDVRKFFKLILPVAAGAGVVQINIFIDMLICSFLPAGGISYLAYADRLNQLPLSTIGVAMGTALLPLLSKQLRQKKYDEAIQTNNLAIQFAFVFALPATIALVVLSLPIISTVYLFGKLTIADATQISYTLRAFALGLPAYTLIKVFNSVYFANQDTKTPIKISIFGIILNVILNLFLMKFWQHVGIALATAISSWVSVFLLVYNLRRKIGFYFEKQFKIFFLKLLGVNTLFFIILYYSEALFWDYSSDKPMKIFLLSSFVSIGILLYVLSCMYVGILSKKDIKMATSKKQ